MGIFIKRLMRKSITSPPGANGCMLLPFFQGRATPQWNPQATASFTNVTLSTTRGDMARALLEGIAYEIRNNLDIVEGQIGKAEKIHIGGGLSKSHAFNQIQADVYGRKLVHYEHRESGIIGAWANTMVESGKASGHEEALKRAGQNDALKIYDPVDEKYKEISGHSWKDEPFIPENVLRFNKNNYQRLNRATHRSEFMSCFSFCVF